MILKSSGYQHSFVLSFSYRVRSSVLCKLLLGNYKSACICRVKRLQLKSNFRSISSDSKIWCGIVLRQTNKRSRLVLSQVEPCQKTNISCLTECDESFNNNCYFFLGRLVASECFNNKDYFFRGTAQNVFLPFSSARMTWRFKFF